MYARSMWTPAPRRPPEARTTPAATVALLPIQVASQATRGLEPSVRNTTRELVRDAEALVAQKVSLMAGKIRPNESLKPLSKKWMRKDERTIVQARQPPSMITIVRLSSMTLIRKNLTQQINSKA